MTPLQEFPCIEEATSAIRQRAGAKPQGWLAPYVWQNHTTLDLPSGAATTTTMDWPSDDQPIWFSTVPGR